MTAASRLHGRTVLLVEDESLVSLLAEDALLDEGCEVVLAMRLAEALEAARHRQFDLAVLDVNLGGGDTSYPVAEVLLTRQVPIMFATGYDIQGLDPRFRSFASVRKPFSPDQLIRTAEHVLAEGATAAQA